VGRCSDVDREVVIVPYRDGPYLVRGPVSMRDQRGNLITLARDPIALCRCGKSQTRPFCDGTHRSIHFQAPSELERQPTSGFQDDVDDRVPGSSARTADPRRRAGERRRKLAATSPVAHAALTRAARAAAMMTDTAGRRACSLIAGALRLLDGGTPGGDAASSLLLIDGALDALTTASTQADAHGARAVTELRAATSALSATS
jgi:CDGSH-type Zn-finger protein